MAYDPFKRGPFPAGVRTSQTSDGKRGGRPLPVEIWYPATDAYRGQDLDEARRDMYETVPGLPRSVQDAVRDAKPHAGAYPLVIFSHGFGGHRRQSTFLCTHLASHGYVVAAPDHTGNTMVDVVQALATAASTGELPDTTALLQEFLELRPGDIGFLLDRVLDGSIPGLTEHVDGQRVGMSGHSFGGWTTLAVTARDRRIRAAVPLAPAGGPSALPTDPLEQSLHFDWGRPVPTLLLAAQRDSLLPVDGMRVLFDRTPSPKRMIVLENADHMHFCDRAEVMHEWVRTLPLPPALQHIVPPLPPMSELCPPEHGYLFVRGLTLAHMDAVLKPDQAAASWIAGDLTAHMQAVGVRVEAVG